MKYLLLLTFLSILCLCCNNAKTAKSKSANRVHIYPTVSYLDIKLTSAGQLPANPYILDFKNSTKEIVFCGVNHLTDYTDINNPLFTKIEERFYAFKPDVTVNEGGDVSEKHYSSVKEAIEKDGEIGLTKLLCDSFRIKTVNGDPSDSLEFHELLKRYSKGELLAYIATERLMWGLKGQYITDTTQIKKEYKAFIQNYIIREGKVVLSEQEQAFDFYTFNYEELLKRPFDIDELEPTNPFEPKGKFQEIGRTSKEIRDQFLLRTIDNLLNTNNKVFVVFGGWHLLTCRAGLEEIINRKRG